MDSNVAMPILLPAFMLWEKQQDEDETSSESGESEHASKSDNGNDSTHSSRESDSDEHSVDNRVEAGDCTSEKDMGVDKSDNDGLTLNLESLDLDSRLHNPPHRPTSIKDILLVLFELFCRLKMRQV